MSIYIREKQLSPEALKILSEVSNKSYFVREAIEFYVHHGEEILKELKDIKELINNVPNLSTTKEIQVSEDQKYPVSIQDNSNKNKEVKKPIESKSEVHIHAKINEVETAKNDIADEKKREIEQQLLRSINMFV